MKPGSALDVVEAAYLPIDDNAEWLRGVLARMDELGLGSWGGFVLRDSLPESSTVVSLPEAGFTPEVVFATLERMDAKTFALACRPQPRVDEWVGRTERMALQTGEHVEELRDRIGMKEASMIGVLGCGVQGTDGVVAFLSTMLPLSAHAMEILEGIGVHLEHASRLRARMASRRIEESSAVFDSSGRTLHLQPDAEEGRVSLADAVRVTEHARGAMRRLAPDEALSAWRGLVDGRWSVVEHTERDGKRLLVAFENTPQTLQFGVAERERAVLGYAALGHSNKYIAYELGWSEPQVSRLLHSGMRKLGLRSRPELIRLWSSWFPGDVPGEPESSRDDEAEQSGERELLDSGSIKVGS
ncbi:MAG TPA: LuxR C-terminal-related transcriptional regulator [Polyangiaceae bacterium]|nr:LuxR C-terminal-related transcriptional regulator [Polyangiaceae bacterium]